MSHSHKTLEERIAKSISVLREDLNTVSCLLYTSYGQRAGKKTLMLDEKGFGGQILNTPEVENYPGIKRISSYFYK